MQLVEVTIEALAPLVFSERRPGGQFRPSTSYVPGSALRGALARQLMEGGMTADDPRFAALFTAEDAPLFHNAYPGRPLPATAYSCKGDGGFSPQDHGVFDSLVDRLCAETLDSRVPYLPRCPKCGDRVEPYGGFYTEAADGARRRVSVPTHLVTRVAVNRRRNAAEAGQLYSPVVLSEARRAPHNDPDGPEPRYETTTFHGSVAAPDAETAEIVCRELAELTHVGSGAARGFGRVRVTAKLRAGRDPVRARCEQLNALIEQRRALWRQLPRGQAPPCPAPEGGTFFTVMLMSDAVLRLDRWTPTLRLEPELLGPAGAGATLVRCYATAEYRGGWNTGWGLPKDTDLVARMGSVYVYHTPEPNWEHLTALEERGVGERRAEGFGQVRVCDEFHCQIQEGS